MKGSLQIKNNKYYAVFRYNGKQKWVSLNIDATRGNKRKAETALYRTLTEYEVRKGNDNNILFVDYLSIWIEDMRDLIKSTTFDEYSRTIISKVIPYFKDKGYKLNDLKPKYFTDYFKYLKQNGSRNGGPLKKKSVKNVRGVLSKVLNTAIADGLIIDNAVENSFLPVFEDEIKEDIVTYSIDEVQKLLNIAKEMHSHVYIFLLLALFTGARRGELLGLMWSNIDFRNKMLAIKQSRTGSNKETAKNKKIPKSPSSNRYIPLPDCVIDALLEERNKRDNYRRQLGLSCVSENEYIILNKFGKPYSNLGAIGRVISRLEEKAGLKHCTIHGFRHTVANILDDNGIPTQEITKLLGHKDITTTERNYIHRSRTTKRENIELLAKLYN